MSGAGLAVAGTASYVGGMTLGAAVLVGIGTSAAGGVVAVGAIVAAPVFLVEGMVVLIDANVVIIFHFHGFSILGDRIKSTV